MRLGSLATLALVFGFAASTSASTFTAGVACNGPFQESVGSGPVSQSCLVGFVPEPAFQPSGSGQTLNGASSSVGPQAMRLQADAILDVTGAVSGNRSVGSQAWGIWEFDDFLVTGTGSGSVSVLGALHLSLGGILFGNGTGDSQGPLTAFVNGVGQIYFEIEINGSFVGYGEASYSFNNGAPIEFVDGLLIGHYGSGGAISDSITSSQLMIPVGQTFDVRVYVNAGARATVAISGTPADQFDTVNALGGSGSHFSSTVTFPTSGPVFDLPPGYTLNSPSAGIVNNQLVPEPVVLALLAASALGLRAVRGRFGARLSE